MAVTKEKKQDIVKKLKENIDKQKSMVFVSINGLKASALFNLREELKKSGCLLSIVKKTLMGIAFKENNIGADVKELRGQIGLIFGFKDEILPAKKTYEFSKNNENLKILGGFFNNKLQEREDIITLAKIPSKEELLAKVVGSIGSPLSGLANVLQGNIRNLVYLLSNIKK